MYSYNINNEINLNLGYVKVAYNTQNLRVNLAMMAGTYANANLASEKGIAKNILEANVGLKLTKKHNLWIDAGVFSSHIGYESAIGKDCYTLSRSIMAENTPFYESGLKLGYFNKNEKWNINAFLLNGWQKIYQAADKLTPSIGTQIVYKPNKAVLINYSTFFGNIKPESGLYLRKFHNFYGQYKWKSKNTLIIGLDLGNQKVKDSTTNGNYRVHNWYATSVVYNRQFKPKWSAFLRLEYFDDPYHIFEIIPYHTSFKCLRYSLNTDYHHTENILLRFEFRTLHGNQAIIHSGSIYEKTNFELTAALSVAF
jgi:hypothetical protein